MLPHVAVVAALVVADTAAVAVPTAVAVVATAVVAVSTAALPSTAEWPRAVWQRAADLLQVGLLPCPPEQASAECLAGASTTVTTSGISPFSGSAGPMPTRTIRMMI